MEVNDPLEMLAARQAARNGTGAYAVTFTDDKPPKLVLPGVPEHDNPAGLCAWLTCVLRLNPQHPVTGAVRLGVRGPDGHVELQRAGAPDIRFEPIAAIYTPRRLFPMLDSQLAETDGEPYGFKEEHARRIAYVIRLLCGMAGAMTANQETAGIIGTFLSAAVGVESHTTHGTAAQRYEAAQALRRELDDHTGRPVGPARYLIDRDTGALVIRVSDLQAAARSHIGSSLPRGWLDARMAGLVWERLTLEGRAVDGRAGRHSSHARTSAYRGHLPGDPDAE